MRHIIFTSLLLITVATASEIDFEPTEKPSNPSYLLETGCSGQKRLDQMQEVYGPFSQSLFSELEFKTENPEILSLGCGTGTRECIMAQLWPKAHITAYDISDCQVDLAIQQAESLGLTNIDFKVKDANELTANNAYDLVCARFFLLHVKNAPAIIEKMVRATKRGGIVVNEELSSSSFFCQPENSYFQKGIQLSRQVGIALGVDYDIGVKLEELMKEQGLSILITKSHQPDRSNMTVKSLLTMSIAEAKPKLIAYFDEQYLDELLNGMELSANQKELLISMSNLYQVVGIKK